MRTRFSRLGLALVALLTGSMAIAGDADLSPAKDAQYLPAYGSGALWWKGREQLAGFRNTARVAPARRIEAGGTVLALPRDDTDLGNVPVTWDGGAMTVDEYVERQRVAGLLVIKDGVIRYERYALGNDENSRWVSFSVAKSVVSLLFGAALRDGYVGSVDDRVTDYLPRLKGSSYDQTTI
ncbi:MAG TPA: serine hydrolase, partial [Pseudomonadales bacterium]